MRHIYQFGSWAITCNRAPHVTSDRRQSLGPPPSRLYTCAPWKSIPSCTNPHSAGRGKFRVSSLSLFVRLSVCRSVCRGRADIDHHRFISYSFLIPPSFLPSCSPDRKIAISSPTKATATRINMEAAGPTSEMAALDVDNFPNIRSTQPKNPRKPS